MKIILAIILLIPMTAICQVKIYQSTTLTIGIYKTYDEFINNSPSITEDFAVVEKNTLRGGSPFDFKIKSGIKVGKVFGFCDGQNVYVKGLRMGGYCKLDYIGCYSFFVYETNGVGLISAAVPDHLVVITDGGIYRDGTVNFVSKFLRKKKPDLADEFDKQEDKKSKRQEYLIKLNEHLKRN